MAVDGREGPGVGRIIQERERLAVGGHEAVDQAHVEDAAGVERGDSGARSRRRSRRAGRGAAERDVEGAAALLGVIAADHELAGRGRVARDDGAGVGDRAGDGPVADEGAGDGHRARGEGAVDRGDAGGLREGGGGERAARVDRGGAAGLVVGGGGAEAPSGGDEGEARVLGVDAVRRSCCPASTCTVPSFVAVPSRLSVASAVASSVPMLSVVPTLEVDHQGGRLVGKDRPVVDEL